MIELREMTKKDCPHMWDFLYEAIFIHPGEEPLPRDIVYRDDMVIYINGFDPQNNRGDCGILAEEDGKIVGMAWVRCIKCDGYVDDETPILSISLMPDYRGQGIGTSVMEQLFDLLKSHGYKQTSLSVQAANPAARLYKRLGYEVHEVFNWAVEVWTMIKKL